MGISHNLINCLIFSPTATVKNVHTKYDVWVRIFWTYSAHLRACSFAAFKRMRAVMRSIWQCLELESTPRGPTRASQAYEISGFPSDFLISALVISDFCCSPQKYTDVRGGPRKYTDVHGG